MRCPARAQTSRSISSSADGRLALDVGELSGRDRQRVVATGVEVGELVDPVEDVADELAQEQPRRDADLAAELAGDGLRPESAR